jgi:hypothetical protein
LWLVGAADADISQDTEFGVILGDNTLVNDGALFCLNTASQINNTNVNFDGEWHVFRIANIADGTIILSLDGDEADASSDLGNDGEAISTLVIGPGPFLFGEAILYSEVTDAAGLLAALSAKWGL